MQNAKLFLRRSLGYRLHKGAKKLYREPVYLITCDLDTPIEQVLQYYFLRWDIEVNHRDEKSLLGVGDAQVRAPLSVTRNPQFVVALYALLLLASIRAYGATRTDDYLPLPKWRRANDRRPSTLDILAQFRREVMATQLTSEARHHCDANSASEKFLPATESTDFVIPLPASSNQVDLPVSIIAALLYADA